MKLPHRHTAGLAALTALVAALTQCNRINRSVSEPKSPPVLSGFVFIPAGEFTMGDDLGNTEEGPAHKVNLSGYYMQQNLVRKAQWDEVRKWSRSHGYADLPEGKSKAADHPVLGVTWYDVVIWCNAKSEMENLKPCYYTDTARNTVYRSGSEDITNTMVNWKADGYRLPTEAEWEKAARGGLSGKRFPWGDTISLEQANFREVGSNNKQTETPAYKATYKPGEAPFTTPVGSFAPNGYGLYDMAGNVWEWCWDWSGNYTSTPQSDPRGDTTGMDRIVRGGDWNCSSYNCRVSTRSHYFPGFGFFSGVGFRTSRSLPTRIRKTN